MRPCPPAIVLIAVLSGLVPSGFARSPQKQSREPDPPKGSIAGSVTIDGKPAPRVTVVLLLDNHDLPIAARTITDEVGHFKFANMSSGRYLARVIAPTWAPAETTSTESEGKILELGLTAQNNAGATGAGFHFSASSPYVYNTRRRAMGAS